jgi:hypothetical protein
MQCVFRRASWGQGDKISRCLRFCRIIDQCFPNGPDYCFPNIFLGALKLVKCRNPMLIEIIQQICLSKLSEPYSSAASCQSSWTGLCPPSLPFKELLLNLLLERSKRGTKDVASSATQAASQILISLYMLCRSLYFS